MRLYFAFQTKNSLRVSFANMKGIEIDDNDDDISFHIKRQDIEVF